MRQKLFIECAGRNVRVKDSLSEQTPIENNCNLERIEIELHTVNKFSGSQLEVKRERREELVEQIKLEMLQIKSSSYSDIIKMLPEAYLALGDSRSSSPLPEEELSDFSEICLDVFNNVEDL